MKSVNKSFLIVLLLSVLASFGFGLVTGKYRTFPYGIFSSVGKKTVGYANDATISLKVAREGWPAAPPFLMIAKDSVFAGLEPDNEHPVYDVVAADMDLDGDLDLFTNGHDEFYSQLFENVGGRFRRFDSPGSYRSGLYDNPGVPTLFADRREMVARIRQDGAPGLYVWHDLDRTFGVWRFHLKGAPMDAGEFTLSLRLNLPVVKITGLDDVDHERPNEYSVRVFLGGEHAGRTFGIGVDGQQARTGHAEVTVSATGGAAPPPLFVGAEWTRSESGRASLWKPDPHGMAWVQAEGSPEPELFLTRGGMRGHLAPPHEPKTDPFFLWQGQDDALYRQADEGVIPRNYARGRKAEWVDINNDGINELYVGNARTPNNLLIRDAEAGLYRDQASRYGLGFDLGETFTWTDWDNDGFEDMIFMVGESLALALNIRGDRFDIVDGRDLGLIVPKLPPEEQRPWWLVPCALHLLDFDNDGQLDLLLSGCGPRLTNRLYRRQAEVYVDVTDSVNLAAIAGTQRAVILDVDNDSFVDIISLEEQAILLRNVQGEHFEPGQLGAGWRTHGKIAGTAGDFDQDGRIDVVFVSDRPHLALNRAETDNRFLDVHLGPSAREPIGAQVRAYYGDGTVQVQRYGSSRNSEFSQVLQPVHFGVPSTTSLDSIGIRWPGSTEEVRYPVQPAQTSLRPER